MKKDTVLSDYLSQEEKDELTRKALEKEEAKVRQGKLFMSLSLAFLSTNVVVTSILYPFYAQPMLERAFIEEQDFSTNFTLQLIIILIVILKLSMVISAVICSAIRKGTRAVIGVACALISFVDILSCGLQLTDSYTYLESSTIAVMLMNIGCLALACLGLYMSVFTDRISTYIYSKNVK